MATRPAAGASQPTAEDERGLRLVGLLDTLDDSQLAAAIARTGWFVESPGHRSW